MVKLPFDPLDIPGTAFRASTFNVKNDRSTGCHAWTLRKPLVANTLKHVLGLDEPLARASIYFLQEASSLQRADLQASMGGAARWNYYTDGKNTVAWDPATWEIRDQDGKGFGPEGVIRIYTSLPGGDSRKMTTVFLRHRKSQEVIVASSTHFAHDSVTRRAQQSKAACEALKGFGENQIVGGDFNSSLTVYGSPAYYFKKYGWANPLANPSIPMTYRSKRSHHDWATSLSSGGRIDHIWMRSGLAARYAYLVDTAQGCQSPSDHCMITVGGSIVTRNS